MNKMGRSNSCVQVWGLVILFGGLSFLPRCLEGQRASPGANVAEQYLKEAAERERTGLGLPALRLDAALTAAARLHALQMVAHNEISHRFSREADLAERGAAAGARFSLITENVAQAPSAIRIHTAWMNSEGHRENLLDRNVDSVGIAVVARNHQLFAVEDFARSVPKMSLAEQERAVTQAVKEEGVRVDLSDDEARLTCEDRGVSSHRADFVMRYTTADLGQIPDQLRTRLVSGKYRRAVVAACPARAEETFSMYRLAVLLYVRP